MLVLTRHPHQNIYIVLEDGREIVVSLCSIKDNTARIGITADKSITIHRDDVVNRMPKEGASA